VTEDKKELYATSIMQQNTILMTQFQKNSTKSILKMQACHMDGQSHRDTEEKHSTDF